MIDVFRVSRFEQPQDASCIVEVDEYIPLRFRTYERPLGVSYLRLQGPPGALVELLIDPNIGSLRGVTVTSLTRFSLSSEVHVTQASVGLPVFSLAWNGRRMAADVACDFRVAVREASVQVHWGDVGKCEAAVFRDRVRFLTADESLVGIEFSGLSPADIETFRKFRE
jgi:hypothetical protein